MFTDAFLDSLKPKKNGKYDIREKTGRGFTVTVFPSGTISFIFFYFFEGRKRRMTLGQYPYMSINQARNIHENALSRLENGIDPAFRKQLKRIDTSRHLWP